MVRSLFMCRVNYSWGLPGKYVFVSGCMAGLMVHCTAQLCFGSRGQVLGRHGLTLLLQHHVTPMHTVAVTWFRTCLNTPCGASRTLKVLTLIELIRVHIIKLVSYTIRWLAWSASGGGSASASVRSSPLSADGCGHGLFVMPIVVPLVGPQCGPRTAMRGISGAFAMCALCCSLKMAYL